MGRCVDGGEAGWWCEESSGNNDILPGEGQDSIWRGVDGTWGVGEMIRSRAKSVEKQIQFIGPPPVSRHCGSSIVLEVSLGEYKRILVSLSP